MSKNILIVAHHYPPHITGVGMVAKNHAEKLVALGHKVTIVTSETSSEEKSGTINGVRVMRVKAWNGSEEWSAPFPLFSPRLLLTLAKAVKEADIVHLHDAFYMSSFFAAVYARWHKKPILLTQHVGIIAHPSRFIVAVQKIVYATTGAIIFRLSDAITTYNDRVEKFLISRGVDKKKMSVLINGVDTELFHPATIAEKKILRQKFGLSPDKKVILFVGRFVPKKGLDKVLAIRSEEYQIVCAGGQTPEKSFDNVVFLGKLDQENLAQLYQAADIFLLPSESEGFPLSVQEAMASGLAIITTNDPGYWQYEFDKDLISLIDQPDEASIVHALQKILHEEGRLEAMAAYSKRYTEEHFSWPLALSHLIEKYDGLLKEKKKKKIAIVSDAIYPFNKGGKEKRLYDITTRLAAQGYDVTIYCMQWWKGEKTIVKDGVTLCAISPYYPLYAGNRRSISEAIFFALHCLKLIGKKFDVIEVDHMPHLVLFTMKIVCVLKRKKMIATWHEVWGLPYWNQYLGVTGIFAYWIEKMSAKFPDLIVSVSKLTTRDLRAVLKTKVEILTIPNGLDLNSTISIFSGTVGADIIFAGRLLSHKNVDVLLRATSILAQTNPDVSLFIIGEGPEKPALEKLTKDLAIENNVLFLGFLEDHDELYRIMQASRVFVLPSTREGFSIAALEANACGLPIITIDHEQNAAKELVVDGQNGTLVALDAIELANAIERSLKAKKDRAIYREYAQKYDWSNIISEIKTVYTL